MSPVLRMSRGILNPNSRMEATIRSTALSFLRGLRAYGIRSATRQYFISKVFNTIWHNLSAGLTLLWAAVSMFSAALRGAVDCRSTVSDLRCCIDSMPISSLREGLSSGKQPGSREGGGDWLETGYGFSKNGRQALAIADTLSWPVRGTRITMHRNVSTSIAPDSRHAFARRCMSLHLP